MNKIPPRSVVVTYDEDLQRLILKAVPSAKLASILERELEMPILLEEYEFRIDDEFIRRLGGGLINIIALGQPKIEQYTSYTNEPIGKPSLD